MACGQGGGTVHIQGEKQKPLGLVLYLLWSDPTAGTDGSEASRHVAYISLHAQCS